MTDEPVKLYLYGPADEDVAVIIDPPELRDRLDIVRVPAPAAPLMVRVNIQPGDEWTNIPLGQEGIPPEQGP